MKNIVLLVLILFGLSNVNAQEVKPMVNAKFSQNAPYNNFCPDNSAAGCGPIAIAQILSFYQQPSHGYGSISYESGDNKYPINVDFENVVFDWNHIKDDYSGNYTEEQAKAVADFVFACGAAMQANYGSSTAINNYANMLYGLQHHLHISKESRYLYRKYYSTAEWIEILNKQLRDGHPIFYRGDWYFDDEVAGHMFVIDGLDSEGKYHVNFGHGGNGNKYCDINILNQNGTNPGGRGVCYNANQAMVINCYPTPSEEDYSLQSCISEEIPILNEDVTLRKISVKLGDKFTLSCYLRNCSAQNAVINYGWGLVQNGKLLKILRQRTYTLRPGHKFTGTRHLDFALPTDLADGTYQLSLYSKSDIMPNWAKVWMSVPSDVDLVVSHGTAEVVIPDNRQGNPNLYLKNEVKEVSNDFEYKVSGRAFKLDFVNPTSNNFFDKIKLTIVADGTEYSYETKQAIYGQSKVSYHILLPQSKVDLKGKVITAVKAYYYNVDEQTYTLLSTSEPTNISNTEAANQGDIYIFTINGILMKHIPAKDIMNDYDFSLKSLPKGVYIIKEGIKTRKVFI